MTRLWPVSGLFYFALVFAAGFLFGAARELLVTPSLGPRAAELLEMPVMLAVIWFSARLLVSRQPMTRRDALGCGLLALALLLCAEGLLVLQLRGLSIPDYIAGHDPVSGAAYLAAILFYAFAPYWLTRRRQR